MKVTDLTLILEDKAKPGIAMVRRMHSSTIAASGSCIQEPEATALCNSTNTNQVSSSYVVVIVVS